jgi:periplasmic protein TonB
MHRFAFVLALLLPAFAAAQGTPIPPTTSGPVATDTPSAIIPPAATGSPHICPHKRYPRAAIAAFEEGVVQLSFTIEADGSVENITVSQSSGYAALDQAAVGCARDWTYRPATLKGIAVAAPWHATVTWAIHGGP